MTIFINREEELKKFSTLGKLNIIFGRRRVGKTRFVKELLKEKIKKKKAIYLLAINKPIERNLERFSEIISKFYNIHGISFKNLKEMFEFFETRKQTEIIVIDEFGYLIKELAEFQEIIDETTTKKLILTGSSISLMESSFLNYKSPLYGRVDKILNLQPLKIWHLLEWFKGIKFEDVIKLFAVTNGIPRYLEFFSGNKEIESQIINNFFNQTFLFYDARKLLEEELRETERYFSILEAISRGKNKLNEIKNFTHIDYQSLPFYLQKLRRLRIIQKSFPIDKKKKSIYEISDLYYSFWFRFVYPYEDEIDSGYEVNAINDFKKNFNSYLGYVFEKICRDLILKTKNFPFTKIGRWWYKDKEIDLVALNEKSKEILFGEYKWKNKVNAEKIVRELAEKASFVQWHNEERKESFAVFAKSFSKRIKEFEGKKVFCFDLKDLERLLQ